jgi:ADP-heptose:LPS heptosyltransferase
MSALIIADRRERALVRTADALLAPAGLLVRRAPPTETPSRILCLRLERIGDLLMTIPALGALRAAFPNARIDLATGSWNRELASALTAVDAVDTIDAGWLSRGAGGAGMGGLLKHAAAWRAASYDLALNFEPDIRSNLAARLSGARLVAGFRSGGGGPLLDVALDYDVTRHTRDNSLALVRRVTGVHTALPDSLALRVPAVNRDAANRLLGPTDRLYIGVHVSGGRLVKQWPEDRFAETARRLIAERGATIVFTGSAQDREMVRRAMHDLPPAHAVDASGVTNLLTVAAILERLTLFITGDTGPMHLARAVDTAIVAVFGPSDPRRYAPDGPLDRVVRVDLPCSPCNRIRNPPARCAGHSPDCLTAIDVPRVLAAVDEVLRARDERRRSAAAPA